jgi:hypothetical protein
MDNIIICTLELVSVLRSFGFSLLAQFYRIVIGISLPFSI